MSDSVIIIPTYNEIGNIETILNQIQDLNSLFDVIVVDDNSPDKTGELVKDLILKKKYKINLLLIERESKNGLGSAYIEGFKKALSLSYNYIFQLDCDGSHNPKRLIDMKNSLTSDSSNRKKAIYLLLEDHSYPFTKANSSS